MDIPTGFFPDAARARRIDQRMRAGLSESIEYLGSCIREQWGESIDGLDRLVASMRNGGAYPPSTFGLYYEATSALMGADEPAARQCFAELLQERRISPEGVRVLTLDQIVPAANRARYQRLMDTDPNTRFTILPPPPGEADAAVRRIHSGLRRLRRAIPELAGEFDALIRELILVAGGEGLGYDFAGGSSYMLWGALFLNAGQHTNDVGVIEALAHESGHSLLFGFTYDHPLVMNDDEELFASPLRDDARPMDGIYHATYVSARMHWAMAALMASGTLDRAETELAVARREADRVSFWTGHATVRSHARLSEIGGVLMDGAHGYMKQFEPAAA
jgi:HEXXH motif-containing protein